MRGKGQRDGVKIQDAEFERLLTRGEVSEILGLARETLSRWAKIGRGPRAVVDGRTVRYRRADVERYINGELH